jgi:2-keto-4-pentenoate hydratase/2-oxohepta-3-ene-1,7-dioic acid hydratase in catechol pathway
MSTTRYVRILDDPPSWARLDDGEAVLLDAPPWAGGKPTGEKRPRAALRLTVPATPSKIVCVGRNYLAHAKELGNEVPAEPLLFFKPPSSLLVPGGTVVLPPESERVEHEGELAVVIGKRGRRIARQAAFDHVFGYAVACDVTARDLQRKDGQWTRAKGFDTFCPLGAELVTGIDPSALSVRVHVNGELRQDGNTKDMAFDVPTLVAYISNVMTLEPGDLILTGTPEGVGSIQDGDTVRVDIGGVGVLEIGVAR